MDALDDRIGLEQQQPVRHAGVQHGAIVARAHDHRGVGRQRAGQAVDQLELVHAPPVLLHQQQHGEVQRVEQHVGGDGGQQVVRPLVERRQHQRQDRQRHEGDQVHVHRRKQQRGAPQSQPRIPGLLDRRIKNAAKQHFLRHGRQQHRGRPQRQPPAPGHGDAQRVNGQLLLGFQLEVRQVRHHQRRGLLQAPAERQKDQRAEQPQQHRLAPLVRKPEGLRPSDLMLPQEAGRSGPNPAP